MFQTASTTRAAKVADLFQRYKRNRDGSLVLVPFMSGGFTDCTVQPLAWDDIAEALVTMTAYAFSDTSAVHEWDSLSNTWTEVTSHWGFLHVKPVASKCLPFWNCSEE